jgi:hypothetical protein
MRGVIHDRYRRNIEGRNLWRATVYLLCTAAGITGHAILAWGESFLRFPARALPLELRSIRRSLLRAPSLPLVVVVAVTVAIATAVAGFYRRTLLDEPSHPEPDRLVFAWGSNVTSGQLRDVVSGPNFLDLRESMQTLEGLAAFHGTSSVLERDGRPAVLQTFDVTVDFLKVLGVSPALGTDFDETHRSSGGPDAVILSHAFWRDQLGSNPSVVGTTLPIDGKPHVIAGVLSPELEFLAPFDLLRSLREDVLREEDRTFYL